MSLLELNDVSTYIRERSFPHAVKFLIYSHRMYHVNYGFFYLGSCDILGDHVSPIITCTRIEAGHLSELGF